MPDLTLDTPVQYVKGVGPRRAEQLAELGIETVEDMLEYYPRRFDLRRQCQPIATLTDGQQNATVAGEIITAGETRFGSKPSFQCSIDDGSAIISARWFHGGYLRNYVRPGLIIALTGKVSSYRGEFQFINPGYQVIYGAAGARLDRDELLPVYPAGAKLTSGVIGQVIKNVLPHAERLIRPWFDRQYLAGRGLPARGEAVVAMHRPEDREHWSQARRRLAYDECLLMQLGIAIVRNRQAARPAHALGGSAEIDRRIRARLPFTLTAAQDRVIGEITADLARPRPMNRLLQGDVGSGKTVVALYAALTAVAHKKQVAIMAPTEILATQHFRKIQQYLAGSKVNVALLSGGLGKSQKDRTLAELAGGEIHLAVGTHALLSRSVKFRDLALVVVDEQHKFGVEQRSGLRGKGFAPHYLVMTATPIPRTLAMTVFGDLDVSTIDELPAGRGKTETRCVRQKQLPEVLKFVQKKLAAGQQAYFIYPLVSASAELQLTAAQDAHEEFLDSPLKEFGVGLIHGQMTAERKDAAMRDFRDGRIKVLVASVVVEVGVDVAAANVMVIMHAERFGLAQLHQLRGRIGRGSENAVCVLVASAKNPLARRRLEVLVETTDGFKIAEEDLRIRGPGEFFGTRQHGLPELKVADLVEDFQLLRQARRDAVDIVEEDPHLAAPHNQQLRKMMMKFYAGRLGLLAGA